MTDREFGCALEATRMRLMRFLCSRMGQRHEDAQDAIQQAMLKAWEGRETFDGRNLFAWLATISRNIVLSRARHIKCVRMVPIEDMVGFDMPSGENQEPSLDLQDTLKHLAALPISQIDAIVLAARGHSLEECAGRIGVEVGTIKSRLSRGRKALKEFA